MRRDEHVLVEKAGQYQVVQMAFVARHEHNRPFLRSLTDFPEIVQIVADTAEQLLEDIALERFRKIFDHYYGEISRDLAVVFVGLPSQFFL